MEEKGGKIVAKEAFLAKDLDFKSALTKIKSTNPEAIIFPGIMKKLQIIKQTWIGVECSALGCDESWDSPKLVEIGGPGFEQYLFLQRLFTG